MLFKISDVQKCGTEKLSVTINYYNITIRYQLDNDNVENVNKHLSLIKYLEALI